MSARGVSVLCALAAFWGCQSRPASSRPAGKVQAAASIFPLADVVRQIGGAGVEVTCLMEPGRSPHDYQVKPAQVERLSRARLLVVAGLGLDDWATEAARAAGAKSLTVLRSADHAEAFSRDEHAEGAGGHHHDQGDPHVWLDLTFMRGLAGEIARALAQADPDGGPEYSRNHDAFVAELNKLDEEYRSTLGSLPNKHFVTFHAAFGHIAERYGLEQMAIRGPDAGGLGTDRLERVAEFMKQHNVKAVFVEPQFPAEDLRALAARTGARIGRLDPLGGPAIKGYDTYQAMMRSNLRAMAEALKD